MMGFGAILNGFIYGVPFAMLGMAKVGGSIAKCREEMKACNMVFYFLVGNVFFLSLISGSLFDEFGQSVTLLNTIPSRLARTVSAQHHWTMLTPPPLRQKERRLIFWLLKSAYTDAGQGTNIQTNEEAVIKLMQFGYLNYRSYSGRLQDACCLCCSQVNMAVKKSSKVFLPKVLDVVTVNGPDLVEDTCLCFNALKDLPRY